MQTFYIGPLEEMARIYQVYKSLGKVKKLTKRDLRRLARILLEEYMKRMRVVTPRRLMEVWCGGRDLNPGSPAWGAGVLDQARRPPRHDFCFM